MKVSDQVSKVFFHHGLFCSTRPLPTLLTVICIFIFFCFPLQKINISRDVPFEAIPLPESKCKSLLSTPSIQKISNDDFNFTFVAQIIFRSAISPQHSDITHMDGLRCNLNASFRIREIVQSTAFFVNTKSNCSGTVGEQKLDSICMRMKDLLISLNTDAINLATTKSPTSRILSLPTPSLPFDGCAVLSPSLIWGNEWSLFHLDDIDLSERLNLNEVQELLDVLFGLPRRHLGMSQMKFRNLPVVNAFATTIVFRDFFPEYIHSLRERLMEAFPDSRFVGKISKGKSQDHYPDPLGKDSEPRVFVVHYRGHNYLVQYAPAFAVYTFLVLYIWFSVSKIDMVKSKFGLAVSACFTIFASLVMTLSLCATLGLMSPALRGREFFPYLVGLIGFENILATTKAVVGTPIDLPVKHRVAQGLAKEGWPVTKNLLYAFFCTALGFLTFDSAIQEFCLIAIISFTTDFFLQMFFFVPVLAIDIRRMELSDLRQRAPLSSIPPSLGNEKTVNTGFCNHSPAVIRSRDTAPPPDYHRRSMSPIPQNSQNLGHRRVHSDASNAAFMSSERNTSGGGVSFRRRFWAFRTNRRVFQHFGMAIVLIWLVIFLCYTLLPSPSPPRPTDSINLASPHLHKPGNGAGESKTAFSETEDVSFRRLFGLRSINLHGFEVRWDADNLWRHMAFSTWPSIADRYNFSLEGRRLVIFEPIHVVQLFSPAEAMHARRPAYEASNANAAAFSKSRAKATKGFSGMVLPEDQEFDSDRTWWSHVLSFGHKDALRALDLPWNGFLDWTTRLWSTATMAAASLLGAGFFLTITATVMLFVHKCLSRSNPNAYREPVVRVRQLVVPLLQKNHSIEEWIVAHGDGEQFSNGTISLWGDGLFHSFSGTTSTTFSTSSHRSRHRGETVDNLIAATVSGYFGGPKLIRSIRLWSADCGHLVATVDRFYPGSFEIRGAGSRHRDLSRRFSPIWSMKVLAPTGSLVAGCANGTIEIWDLDNFDLRQVIDLTSPEDFYNAQGELVETGGEPTPVGGVTVIEASLENQHIFYFGTSLGFVGCVKWALTPSSSTPTTPTNTEPISRGGRTNRPQWSVRAKWSAHPRSRGVVHLTPQRVPLPHRCFTPRSLSALDVHCLRSGGVGGCSSGGGSLREDWALVSGAMDGSLALIQPRHFRFQRFHWDPSHLLCADFLQSTIVVGQASGRLRMLSLTAAVPPANKDLHVEVFELCTISAMGATATTPTAEGSLGSASWIRLFKISTPSSTEDFRLVTYCHTGAVSVWSIHASSCHLIRRFPANTPAFAIRAPIICVDDRVIFGERGYLRLVNPRTAKYERSVQLMPPLLTYPTESVAKGERTMDSQVNPSVEQWERGLGPLGITGGSDGHQYLCGLSDAGKSLFIVPKSVLLN
ncbi:sterol regulatory element binding protein [Echinococcus multilocularis]|uniref:Sterol regulatory element-binding protein cleavage-activating protein n=1 Tax=Echinococcus multilocularis TaxID=6211 RepID=A0A068Y8W8_ECHMU|nr:sterol regulatory element binding protein [Echinococcus multilocularis]